MFLHTEAQILENDEALWATPRPPAREHLAPVARSLGQLERLTRDGDGFPLNFYEASELHECGAIVREDDGRDYCAAMLELTRDKSEHPLHRRLSRSPFLVGPPLALTTNQSIVVWPAPLHILGERVIALWLCLSPADLVTDCAL